MKRRLLLAAVLVLTAGLTISLAGATTSSAGGHVKNFKHIFVIMMENTGIEALQGNTNAPWINQAMQTYAVAGNYYGVTHPSQPNYIASTAGTTAGVPDDNDVTVNLPNIVDQLEAKHHTWKAYMQGLSLCTTKLDHACGNQLYERKHDPFVSFADVQSNPARMADIVDFSQLATDLASKGGKAVPDFAYISPDQCHDMHGRGGGGSSDPCDFSNEQQLIAAGDTFLKRERLHGFADRLRLRRHPRLLRRQPGRRPRPHARHPAEPVQGPDCVLPALQPLLDARDDRGQLEPRLSRLHVRRDEREADERPDRLGRLLLRSWAGPVPAWLHLDFRA